MININYSLFSRIWSIGSHSFNFRSQQIQINRGKKKKNVGKQNFKRKWRTILYNCFNLWLCGLKFWQRRRWYQTVDFISIWFEIMNISLTVNRTSLQSVLSFCMWLIWIYVCVLNYDGIFNVIVGPRLDLICDVMRLFVMRMWQSPVSSVYTCVLWKLGITLE